MVPSDQYARSFIHAHAHGIDIETSPNSIFVVVDRVWQDIREACTDVPPVAVSIRDEPGTQCGYAPASAGPHVLCVPPSQLDRTPREVLAYITHAAAHALAEARGHGQGHGEALAAIESALRDVPLEGHVPAVAAAQRAARAGRAAQHGHTVREGVPGVPEARAARAVHAAWESIRQRHPDVPPASVILASGTPADARRKHVVWCRWENGTLTVATESLGRGPRWTLTVMLRAAAHALAEVRGASVTSRAGRYHNALYAQYGECVGLQWPEGARPDPRSGYADMVLREDTAEDYAQTLADLAPACEEAGTQPREEAPARGRQGNVRAVCACAPARPVRLSRVLAEAGSVACTRCGEVYRMDDA